jgi:hypothetical protein
VSFTFLALFMGAENRLRAGAGSPEPSNLLPDERVLHADQTSSLTSISGSKQDAGNEADRSPT